MVDLLASRQQLVELDLTQLIDDTLRVFAQDPRFESVSVDLELPESEIPLIRADPEKTRQLLWNLLRNAAEAASEGGNEVKIALQADENAVELRVSDNGPGIPEESIKRVFDPFFTTKGKGSGLGLATVHSIVMDHGGTEEAESRPDSGACFVVRLPYNAERDDGA